MVLMHTMILAPNTCNRYTKKCTDTPTGNYNSKTSKSLMKQDIVCSVIVSQNKVVTHVQNYNINCQLNDSSHLFKTHVKLHIITALASAQGSFDFEDCLSISILQGEPRVDESTVLQQERAFNFRIRIMMMERAKLFTKLQKRKRNNFH